MEFRLLYDGQVPSSGNTGKAKTVHSIRRIFHPQLRRLWHTEKNLWEMAMRSFEYTEPRSVTEEERFKDGLAAIGNNWSRAGYQFVPLVTPKSALRCSLDILLLRPEIQKSMLMRRGDLDGQLKTIVDALRIPDSFEEAGKIGPSDDETPFFCLLEDDKLVTELHVITDKLLLLPHQKQVGPHDAFAVINVKLNYKDSRSFDNFFG